MIRAVFDTNTLASIAVAASGPLASLFAAWRRRDIEVIVTLHILAELDHALGKPYFANRLNPKSRDEFRLLARTATTIVDVSAPVPTIATTRADNLVLAAAESAHSPYLVTGDGELLGIVRYENTLILTPRQFLELVARGDSEPG